MTIDEARYLVIDTVLYAASEWMMKDSVLLDALDMVLNAAREEGFGEGYYHAQETVGDWNRP